MCLLPTLPSLGLRFITFESLRPLPSLASWDFKMEAGDGEQLVTLGQGFSQGLGSRAREAAVSIGNCVASPRRQLLGGLGWEGHLPHVPAAEGQEDGRPPSSPLCLLQQDWTFCGETPSLLFPREACSQERGPSVAGQGETVVMAQHRGRRALHAEPALNTRTPSWGKQEEAQQGREDGLLVHFH